MGRFGLGQSLRRVEDQRLLTGRGRFTDDHAPPGQLHGQVVRSPHGHGVITRLDVTAARAMPGVRAVLTIADLDAAGIGLLPTVRRPRNPAGEAMPIPPRPVLARERVRFAGEPVAFVVAETLAQARDAAEAVDLEIEPLPAAATLAAALAPGAPEIWPDLAPGNVLTTFEMGDEAAVAAAFAAARHVVRLPIRNQRLAPTALEPRAALGSYDPATEAYTLHSGSQGSHTLRRWLCQSVLGIAEDRLRVVAGDVGGGFGMRLFLFPEQVLVLVAARLTGRPVKWVAERGEGFLSDTHGRDQDGEAALAVDADGRFLAVRLDTAGNVGAYVSQMGAFVPTLAGTAMLPGVYAIPAAFARVRVSVTNTAPVDAYRGAGRPEMAYVIERLADAAARLLGLGRDEIRRRNFIPPQAMPYRTCLGKTYDSGEFARLMTLCQQRADWDGFPARRAAAAARGRLRGLGLAYYVEAAGGGDDETAHLSVGADGAAEVLIGSQSTGQGHETAYGQMVAAALGLPLAAVTVVQGDTARVPTGRGTGGSRSLPVGGAALSVAVDALIATGQTVAARLLDTEPEAVTFTDGLFKARNQARTLAEVAAAAPGGRLSARGSWQPPEGTYPNGCHIVEVEIDPATGATAIDRYTVVDDVGVVVNPDLLRGQIVGGIAQGVGQALLEHCVYDPDSGQLLSGTLMDYALPRVDLLPPIDHTTVEIPCRTNLLGIKGAGEAGTIGATPAVIGAVLDALAPAGVHAIDMPATPFAVWTALREARARPQPAA